MHPFAYAHPASLAEALTLLGEHGGAARVLAGGTDLVVALRNGEARPAMVIDVKRIADMPADLRESEGRLSIGATAVMAQIEEDARVRALFPALAEAAAVVGSIQIRNRATLAGNICHASPAADTAPALLAYGAEVTLVSGRGSRHVPITEFFTGPGQTVVDRDELVTSIHLPAATHRRGAAFARVTRRRGVDLATVNLCCVVDAGGHTRFGYGAVGPRPFLVTDDSGSLADPAVTDAARDAVLRELVAHASPISDVRGGRDYREAMLLVMSRRVLRTAVARMAAA